MKVKKNILIVEDNEDLLEFLKISLEEKYHVKTATTGEEFLKKVKTTHPDILLVDIKLPDATGDLLVAQLREENQELGSKIYLMSAYDDVGRRAKLVEADGYLQKPFSIQKLFSLIN